jgi:Tetratricopeptide repeat
VAFREGNHARVGELCERAIPLWQRIDDRTVVTSPVHMLAESARLEGDLEKARTLYEQSVASAERDGDAGTVAMELNNLALLELQAGNADRAETLAMDGLSMVPGTRWTSPTVCFR